MTVDDDGLAFFNELVGELEIQLTEQGGPARGRPPDARRAADCNRAAIDLVCEGDT